MKLASVELIKNIKVHPNADSLELAQVLGWQTVVKKGVYKEGDKVVFVTIDSIVPRCKWSEFLVDPKNPDRLIRIKNIKLRGEYSSGLVISLGEFSLPLNDYEIGYDLTDLLGIQKYIKELPTSLGGENSGDFPSQIAPKTDEDNGLNDPNLVERVLLTFDEITITQKADGSSITLIIEDGELKQVCSRNLSKKETEQSTFWNAARKLNIPKGWTGTIQGELCGPGIQKNLLRLSEIEIIVFQISQNNTIYLTYDEMVNFCKEELKCKTVSLVSKVKRSEYSNWENPLAKLQDIADNQFYNKNTPGEGIVVRPSNYPSFWNSRRPLGFKLINRNYID